MNIKIQVTGASSAAAQLRQHLVALGYQVVERSGKYSVEMINGVGSPCDELAGTGWGIEMEAADGEFGKEARSSVAELCGAPVCWRHSEALKTTELRVLVPAGSDGTANGRLTAEVSGRWDDVAARGVLRAILKVTRHGEPGWFDKQPWFPKQGWWNRFMGRNQR